MNNPYQPNGYYQQGYQQQGNMQGGYNQQYQQAGYQQPHQQQQMRPAHNQGQAQRPHHQPNSNYQPVNQQKVKGNQIMPAQPRAKDDEEKPKVNWGRAEDSSTDSDVAFVAGNPYCCGLFNSGDSMCYNSIKFFIVFVVCPLACYWMYKSGNLEKLVDKAGATLQGGCSCCRKLCVTVSAKIRDCSCLTKTCNSDKCKHCCGLQRCCEGVCKCLKGACGKGCFSKFCGWFKNCVKCNVVKDFCGRFCSCFKDAIKCGSIKKFCSGIFKCNFDKLNCCNRDIGCKNPCQCCGDLPCFQKCKDFDTCSCCDKAGAGIREGGKKVGGCCSGLKERFCNCCFDFRKKAGSKGSSFMKNFGRGRYKPKGKFILSNIF